MPANERVISIDQAYELAARLYRERRLGEAVAVCRETLRLRPGDGRILSLQGLCFLDQGETAGAIKALEAARTTAPGDLELAMNLGRALEALPDANTAVKHYEALIRDHPDYPSVWHRLGALTRLSGRREAALEILGRANELATNDPHIKHEMGIALYELGRYEHAEQMFAEAQSIEPSEPAFRQGRGLALHKMGRLDDASSVLSELVSEYPEFIDGLLALAAVRRDQGAHDAAAQCLKRALDLRPDDAEVLTQLGILERSRGRFQAALAAVEHAIAVRPDHVTANYNRARLLILLGRPKEGYDEYDRWRWLYYPSSVDTSAKAPGRPFTQPKWDGSPIDGRHLLVWGEQGVGDEIMYARMLPAITESGARCTVECDHRLVQLFRRSFPDIRIVARTEPPNTDLTAHDIDFQIPMASLCRWFHPGPDTRIPSGAYLKADPELTATLRDRYAATGECLVIGFSWLSGNRHVGRARSIDLETLLPIFSQKGARFINLQYGDHHEEIERFNTRLDLDIVDDDIDPLIDLDAFASQVAATDLVISIDNTTVHMAGALDRPVWTMLPLSPDPRWLADGGSTVWHRSMRLFRQRQAGDWEDVVGAVARALDREIQSRREH